MSKHWVMAVDKPDDIDIQKYIGRTVSVFEDNKKRNKRIKVEIESIQGSLAHPTMFQVNTKNDQSYLISMLDFYAQMNGEKIDQGIIDEFDAAMFHVEKPRQSTWEKRGGIWKKS